jgi:putative sigma-54 modulation protein
MKAGIWIDLRKAVIVLVNGDNDSIMEVESNVEEMHTGGGYGGARKDMPQDARSDKKVEAHRQKQMRVFFNEVMKNLPKLERLLVFGPGDGRKFFTKALREKTKFAETRIKLEPSDQMTLNQIHAKVQEYFRVKNTKAPKSKVSSEAIDSIDVKHEFVKIPVSDATEILVNEKLALLKKRYDRIVRARVFYKKDKDPKTKNFVCELELSIPGENLFATSRSEELVKAIAETFKDMERQLRRWKSKKDITKVKASRRLNVR